MSDSAVIRILAKIGEKFRIVAVQPNSKIDDLYRTISEQCARRPEDFHLISIGQVLEDNGGKTLEDYAIVDNSPVIVAFRVLGGLEHDGTTPLETVNIQL